MTTELAPTRAPAPMINGPQDLGPRPNHDPVAQGRMALALAPGGPAEGHAVIEGQSSPISAVSPMTTPLPWSMKKRSPMLAPGWMSMPVQMRAM